MLKNQWDVSSGQDHKIPSIPIPYELLRLPPGLLAPIQVILKPEVGVETALVCIEEPAYVNKITRGKSQDLRLYGGTHPSVYGPVLYFLWWFGEKDAKTKPSEVFETLLNPHDPDDLRPYRDLDNQECWHVFFVEPSETVIHVNDERPMSEFRGNKLGSIAPGIAQAKELAADLACLDFELAVEDFQAKNPLEKLVRKWNRESSS